ncbi:hypothetical protein X777_05382, partial [Ooceraea biroi]
MLRTYLHDIKHQSVVFGQMKNIIVDRLARQLVPHWDNHAMTTVIAKKDMYEWMMVKVGVFLKTNVLLTKEVTLERR